MAEHFNGSLRRSLLAIFVVDLALLLVLAAFFVDGPWLRLGAALSAVLLPIAVFVLTDGPFARLAVQEWRLHGSRSLAAALGVFLGTAALAVSVGTRPNVEVGRHLASATRGGPADIVVESGNQQDASLVRESINDLLKRPEMQQLLDARPLELRWAPAWVRTDSAHRVRVVALDVASARTFGGDKQWTGLADASAALGISIGHHTAHLLAVGDASAAARIDVLTGEDYSSLSVLQVLEERGLLGIPAADGRYEPTLFVDPQTFDRLRADGWTEPVRYWSVLSLCGTAALPTATPVGAPRQPDAVEPLTSRRCSVDPWSSVAYSDRVEQELNTAIASNVADSRASVQPEGQQEPAPPASQPVQPVDDNVLFDQPGDGEGVAVVEFDEPIDSASDTGTPATTTPATSSANKTQGIIRVDPVKQLALQSALWSDSSTNYWDKVVGGLLATGSMMMVAAGCFVDRRRRSARERLVGVANSAITGTWAIVIGLSALPGALAGAAVGSGLVSVVSRLAFKNSLLPWGSALSATDRFATALAWSAVVSALISLTLGFVTQKIPLVQAVRGAPLMTARRWVPFAAVCAVLGVALFARSGLRGWTSQAGVGLVAAGLGLLSWSLLRSRHVVAAVGAATAIVSLALLRRTWSGSFESGPRTAALVAAVIVAIGGLAGAYVATAPGQHAASLGVPRTDAPALSALRTRVATRPGPWPMSPLVGAVLSMTVTCVAASVIIGNGSADPIPAGQRNGVVLREAVDGAALSALGSVPSLKDSVLVQSRTVLTSGLLPSLDPAVPAPDHRRVVQVGSLGSSAEQWPLLIGSRAAEKINGGLLDQVVVVSDVARAVFGVVPNVGSTIRLAGGDGSDKPVVVAAIVARGPGDVALWTTDLLFESVAGAMPQEGFLFVPSKGSAADLRHDIQRASLGGDVVVSETFSRVRQRTQVESFGRWLLNVVIALHLLNAAVLVWRWSSERRRSLLSTRSAALGPAYLARSVNQDATAHVGVAAFVGSVFGLVLGWTLLPAGSRWAPSYLHVAVILAAPALVAALVARVPYVNGSSRRSLSAGHSAVPPNEPGDRAA